LRGIQRHIDLKDTRITMSLPVWLSILWLKICGWEIVTGEARHLLACPEHLSEPIRCRKSK
jgi:hypothetical protein